MSRFPVCRAVDICGQPPERLWLVEGLWGEQAVGIVGGEPKCFKSFLSLDVAVAVASGTPCLRRYRVPRRGRVLLFAGEDSLHEVRRRLDGIAIAAGLTVADLDIFVITAPLIRLDRPEHRKLLAATVSALKPRLLILDPFVRLHRIDENVSSEVAPLLAYLRALQRLHQTAVLLVHHSRKGAAHARAGQALRGSSEFHAWGDSNLYLRRRDNALELTVEHRTAPSAPPVPVHLVQKGPALALEVVQGGTAVETTVLSPSDRVGKALSEATKPMTVTALRAECKMRTETVCEIIDQLVANGQAQKTRHGYIRTTERQASLDFPSGLPQR